MKIKCTCRNTNCKKSIRIGTTAICVEDDFGKEILIYTDANALIELIKEAKKALLLKAGLKESEY